MTRKPSDQILESLSAMADSEASEIELRRILRELDEDDSVLDRWQRYNLVGAVMRNEAHSDCSVNLLAGISQELYGESTVVTTDEAAHLRTSASGVSTATAPRWPHLLGQSMVAASVAVVCLLGFQISQSTSDNSGPSSMMADTSAVEASHSVADTVPLGFDLPLPTARVVSGGNTSSSIPVAQQVQPSVVPGLSRRYGDDLSDVATQRFLDELLIEHAGRASVNGNLGFMPYARVSRMGAE